MPTCGGLTDTSSDGDDEDDNDASSRPPARSNGWRFVPCFPDESRTVFQKLEISSATGDRYRVAQGDFVGYVCGAAPPSQDYSIGQVDRIFKKHPDAEEYWVSLTGFARPSELVEAFEAPLNAAEQHVSEAFRKETATRAVPQDRRRKPVFDPASREVFKVANWEGIEVLVSPNHIIQTQMIVKRRKANEAVTTL